MTWGIPFIGRLRWPDWRLSLGVVFAMAILHITTTFMTPATLRTSAYDRLSPALPVNVMSLLPAVTHETQLLPFQASDTRWAVCHFDTTRGGVELNASLPMPGWSLTIYDPAGGAVYAALAQPDRRIDISLLLVPDDDRFLGLTPESQGRASSEERRLRIEARRGIAVLRAPDPGIAYRARIETELRQARCAATQRL